MGINCSSISSVRDSEYAAKLSGKETVSEHDPFWNQLFSFTFRPPMDRDEAIKLEQITEAWCRMLFENNQRTGTFSTLVKLFLSRSGELIQSVDCENKIFVWQTQNALFIIRHLCKFGVENMSEEKIVEQFEARSLEERKAELASSDVLTSLDVEKVCFVQFIEALVDVIINLPVIDFTYQLHVEAINMFLVLLSPQIFISNPSHLGVVSQTIASHIPQVKINLLMRALLQNFIERKPIPTIEGDSKPTESLVIGLASAVVSGLKSAITFGGAPVVAVVEEKDLLPTIGRQSCLLSLALCMQCSPHQDGTAKINTFQESLRLFRHVQGPQFVRNNGTNTKVPSASFHINLSRLYATVCDELTSELTTLLLYNLLHQNTDVRAFILSKTDVESLVLPLLKVLYAAPMQNSHHVYMALIVLLILTEDNHFNKSVHEVPIEEARWYTDRQLTGGGVSLGDLIILVLIRTVQFNMSQMRDQYLHTNCLAALANMSSYFKRLHHYAAQRIFQMLSMLASKMQKLHIKHKEMQLAASNPTTPEACQHEVHLDMESSSSMDLGVVQDITRMLLEIVNSCLTGNALRNNANLIYSLLQSRTTFEKLASFDHFQDLLQNIHTLLQIFDDRLEQMNEPTMTVEEVHEFIGEVVVQIPSHRLKKYPELKFRYVEEERPEEFFVPYVWNLIYHKSGVFWNPGCVQLFTPLH